MHLEKKTEFVEQLEKLLHEFSARFRDFKSHEHLFEIFSSPFNTDVDRAPADIQLELIDLQQQSDLKAKYSTKKTLVNVKALTKVFLVLVEREIYRHISPTRVQSEESEV